MNTERAASIYESMKEEIRSRNARQIFSAFGYTSDLDLILDFTISGLNDLLEQHVPDGCLAQMRPVRMIRTMPELLETIVYYSMRGLGGEADIGDPALIRDNFPYRKGIGGTGAQAALALSAVGADSVLHLSDDSEEVLELLESPHIRFALPDGSLGYAHDVKSRNPGEVHVILQYRGGEKIRLGAQEAEIPCSNRLILTKKTVNGYLPLDEDCLRWVEEHARQVRSIVPTSFNNITDGKILADRLARAASHFDAYRSANPDGIIYFEGAHYHDEAGWRACMETVCPETDIFGMNEEEFLSTLELYGEPLQTEDVCGYVHGMRFLLDRFRVRRGILLHTADFSMYLGDQDGLAIERGMVCGSLLAGAKAQYGTYGTDREIREILKMPFSTKGLQNMERIRSSGYRDEVILVPSFDLGSPRYTIGLGDCFTAGMQFL